MKHPKPNSLTVDARITKDGITILLNEESFPIVYPKKIWSAYNPQLKEILRDTLAHSATFYVPSILKIPEIQYKTARPMSESFLYKNGIYDITYCANVDKQSSTDYMKQFFKTRYRFASEEIKLPTVIKTEKKERKQKTAIIPFSFGKESMLTYALCKELGIKPILVSIIDPSHKYEYHHKKPLIDAFMKQEKVEVHVMEYNPGWFWEGRLWGITTELGWGLHTTDYSLMMLPFVSYFNADYIINGNEQSCKDTYIDKEGWFIYRAGFDQHPDWTHTQGELATLMLGRRVEVLSLVEPLYELTETKILQGRYKDVGQYQMSCFAFDDDAKNARWCQNCSKCAYFYLLFTAWGVDPKKLGYTESMLEKNHAHLFDTFFIRTNASHYYGSQGELGLAFYYSYLNGVTGYTMDRFKKELLSKFKRHLPEYKKEYAGIHETQNMPADIKKRVMKIYHEELDTLMT